MRGTSHLIIGGAIGAVIVAELATPAGSSISPAIELMGIITTAFAALLPDVDHPGSTLGRFIPRFLWPEVKTTANQYGYQKVGRRFFGVTCWHRGQCHSLGFTFLMTLLFSALYYGLATSFQLPGLSAIHLLPLFVVCFIAGILSHLLADCINVSKMMIFWPFNHNLFRTPGHHFVQNSLRGQLVEKIIVIGVVILAIWACGLIPSIISTFHR